MKPAILLAAFLAAGAALQAQLPSSQAKVDTTGGGQVLTLPPVAGCPVSLRALQGSGGQLVATRNGRTTPLTGQRIHLLVTNLPKGKTIATAQVTAAGLPAHGHLHLTGDQAEDPPDLRRTIDVILADEDAHTQAADLVLNGFAVVNSVRLDSITYTDGSQSSLPDHRACTVTPDRFMLVADK